MRQQMKLIHKDCGGEVIPNTSRKYVGKFLCKNCGLVLFSREVEELACLEGETWD